MLLFFVFCFTNLAQADHFWKCHCPVLALCHPACLEVQLSCPLESYLGKVVHLVYIL